MKKLLHVLLASSILIGVTLMEALAYVKLLEYFPQISPAFPAIAFSVIWIVCLAVLLGVVFKTEE